jgi:hypothetical protein
MSPLKLIKLFVSSIYREDFGIEIYVSNCLVVTVVVRVKSLVSSIIRTGLFKCKAYINKYVAGRHKTSRIQYAETMAAHSLSKTL